MWPHKAASSQFSLFTMREGGVRCGLLRHEGGGFVVHVASSGALSAESPHVFLRLLPVLAWLLLAAVAFVTLAPIGFRPVSGFSPNLERFATFGLLGFVFALAYPRRVWLILAIVIASAVAFEALQLMAHGRHGRLLDLGVKIAGGVIGVGAGRLVRLAMGRPAR